jgi:DNA modification methylase
MAHNPLFLTGNAMSLPIADNSIDLIITHPPYLKVDVSRYGGDQTQQINYKQDKKTMLNLLIKSAKEMERVLSTRGSLFICIGPVDGLPYDFISEVQKKTSLKLIAEIVWHFSNRTTKEQLGKDQGLWFHLSKNPESIYFNPFIIKRYSGSPWVLPMTNIDSPTDKLLTEKKVGFILDTFPEEIASRFIQMFTKPGGTVLDPFGGSGVVASQAYILNRKSITNDVSPTQTSIAKKRLNLVKENA